MIITLFIIGLAIGFIIAVVLRFGHALLLEDCNEQLDNLCQRQELNLSLAYQRIDELEERCCRLHQRLLEAMKRRAELADLQEIREGDFGRYRWINWN